MIVVWNEERGCVFVDFYGFVWCFEVGEVIVDVFVNVILIGMFGGLDEQVLVFIVEVIVVVLVVFDVVVFFVEMLFIFVGCVVGKMVIMGVEVVMLQVLEQFVFYMGICLFVEQVCEVEEFMCVGIV